MLTTGLVGCNECWMDCDLVSGLRSYLWTSWTTLRIWRFSSTITWRACLWVRLTSTESSASTSEWEPRQRNDSQTERDTDPTSGIWITSLRDRRLFGRTFAHSVIGHWIDPSWWTHWNYFFPNSASWLVWQRSWYALFCLWDSAYKRSLAANWNE